MKEAVLGRPHDSLIFVVEVKGIEPLAPCMQNVLFRIYNPIFSFKVSPYVYVVVHG